MLNQLTRRKATVPRIVAMQIITVDHQRRRRRRQCWRLLQEVRAPRWINVQQTADGSAEEEEECEARRGIIIIIIILWLGVLCLQENWSCFITRL